MAARSDTMRTLSPWMAVLIALETGFVGLVVIFGMLGALTTFAGGGDGPWNIEAAFWGIANAVAAGVILVGALRAGSSPRRGTLLLAIGAVAMAGLWYWVWMVSVPLAAVLIALAVMKALNLDASPLSLETKGVKS